MVQTLQQTTEPAVRFQVVDALVVQVEQVHFPVVAQRQFPTVQTLSRVIDISQLLNTVADVLLCDFTCFRMQRNAWTSVLHAMRQPTVLWLFSAAFVSDSHLF